MVDEAQWRIDPGDLKLSFSRDHYTASEFARQVRPPCPVCGAEVRVYRVDVTTFGPDPEPAFIPRDWQCLRGCAKGRTVRSPA